MRTMETGFKEEHNKVVKTKEQDYTNRKWHIHCPVCGSKIARSKEGDLDIDCHKCHSRIGILVSEGMVTGLEKTDRNVDEKKRMAVYMEKISHFISEL